MALHWGSSACKRRPKFLQCMPKRLYVRSLTPALSMSVCGQALSSLRQEKGGGGQPLPPLHLVPSQIEDLTV